MLRRAHQPLNSPATPALVPLHVAPHAERLAAAGVRAAERFFARVRVAVDLEARGPREDLVARLADIALPRLRVRRVRRRPDVVVMFQGVGRWQHWRRVRLRREAGG